MRARVLQRALSSTLWGTTHTQILFINVHLISAHISLWREKKEKIAHHLARMFYVLLWRWLFFLLRCLSRSTRWVNEYSSRVRKWSTFLSERDVFFSQSTEKSFARSLLCARARIYLLHIFKALLNAPDENSRTHVRVCVFSTFFFTERMLFLLAL